MIRRLGAIDLSKYAHNPKKSLRERPYFVRYLHRETVNGTQSPDPAECAEVGIAATCDPATIGCAIADSAAACAAKVTGAE